MTYDPIGYIGQSSFELISSGQSAACVLSKQEPSVQSVAVYTAAQLEAAILAECNRVKPNLHLMRVFLTDMTERNWWDKRAYILQQLDRIDAHPPHPHRDREGGIMTEIPKAHVSRLPYQSGDGYSFGGEVILTIGERSFLIGATRDDQRFASELADAWNHRSPLSLDFTPSAHPTPSSPTEMEQTA